MLVHFNTCTLLCTFYEKNLDFLSIYPEIRNQYITHDVLESESAIWAQSRSRSPTKNKDSASPSTTDDS